MDLCEASGSTHLLFRRLMEARFEGVLTHAVYIITAG